MWKNDCTAFLTLACYFQPWWMVIWQMILSGKPHFPTWLAFCSILKAQRSGSTAIHNLSAGQTPSLIFAELQAGLEEIGKGYEDPGFRRYFNSDLIVSGRNMKRAIDLLKPLLPPKNDGKGLVVIGTVAGDVHDIGKTIFAVTLESDGFFIIDTGVDVPCATFIEAVRENKPDILAMSSLLTTTLPAMNEVIQGLEAAGLRDSVRIIVGGHAVTGGLHDLLVLTRTAGTVLTA